MVSESGGRGGGKCGMTRPGGNGGAGCGGCRLAGSTCVISGGRGGGEGGRARAVGEVEGDGDTGNGLERGGDNAAGRRGEGKDGCSGPDGEGGSNVG